jgi:ATP-dependent DNA helicase MPH1
MEFIDNEAANGSADESQDDSILVPSSQSDIVQRPRKRRRITVGSEEDDDDEVSLNEKYDLPHNDYTQADTDDVETEGQISKYDDRTHVPQYAATQKDTFVTQLSQPWSSPSHIRGPRWQRQQSPRSPIRPEPESNAVGRRNSPTSVQPKQHMSLPPRASVALEEAQDDFEDDDDELFDALMSAEMTQHNNSAAASFAVASANQATSHASQNLRQTTLFGTSVNQPQPSSTQASRVHNWPLANRNETPTHHSIDTDAMKTWIYPINVGTIRDYQYNIVHKGLFHNLLVALPTGLGKTFIAATIMLNWFRWTKDAQIIFVAPTKPLVAQQIDACFHIAGIPRSQTTLLTGETSPAIRAEEWQEKRVFFMTPQTLINDLKSGYADPKKIVLLVVDEAHKATGNYAYVEVVRFLQRFSSSFRVLALTATPGATVEAVQKVIDGLNISRVEIRTEDSMDIRQFVHSRDENLERFDYSLEMQECLDLFRKAAQPVQNKLCSQNAYWKKDPVENTVYGLLMAQKEWSKSEAAHQAGWHIKAPIQKSFQVLMSLAHNIELLKYHGMGPFYHKMKIFDEDSHAAGKYHKMVTDNEHFKEMMNRLKSWINLPDFVGHPKLTYLKEVALNHFLDAGEGQGAAGGRPPSQTRIMIFAHYRDSAEEIVRVLKRHEPMVRPHIFVGQSSTKGSEGMDQKTQQRVIEEFKTGKHNILVATSIGEEGLDIGEVDLIVCYDASKSPIRMLQRMGRTGRKRAGNVHVLLMKGKEEKDFASAKDNYRKMQELIACGKEFTFHEDKSARIVPKAIQPIVDKRVVEIPIENTQDGSVEPRRKKARNAKKPAKRFNMPDGVETGFQFVGAGKKPRTKQQPTERRLDLVDAPMPSIAEVILRDEDEVERQMRYGEVSGSQPQFITIPRFDANKESFRRLSKTARVKHGAVTKTLFSAVAAYRRRRSDREDWTRPSADDVLQDYGSMFVEDGADPMDSMNQKPNSAKSKRKTTEATALPVSSRSPTPDIDNVYSELGSFIDDAMPEQAAPSTQATTPDSLLSGLEKGAPSPTIDDEPFWVSQREPRIEIESGDDELSGLEDMLGSSTKKLAEPRSRARISRRVVDSDDDD